MRETASRLGTPVSARVADCIESPQADAAYDVFVDLTANPSDETEIQRILYQLHGDSGLTQAAAHTTVALPAAVSLNNPDWQEKLDLEVAQPPTLAFERTLLRAAAFRHHLVLLLGPLVPPNEVIAEMVDALAGDPMFGSAQPRFAEAASNHIWPLPGGHDRQEPTRPTTSRHVLGLLPSSTITAEMLAACIVVRWNVVAATDGIEHAYTTVMGALLDLLCKARRRGLRNIVVNRAVVRTDLAYRSLYPAPSAIDIDHLRSAYPDIALAESENRRLSQRQLEPLLSAAHVNERRRRFLLDCRGMSTSYNGTAQCVLGFLAGFAALDCLGSVDVLVSPQAAQFHSLALRYPAVRQVYGSPRHEYFAAITLTQPWSLHTVAELHRYALLNAFCILDTIAWDVLYLPGTSGLQIVWQFVARHADALFFISHFSRERFTTRFQVDSSVAELVTHLSLQPHEHVVGEAENEPVSDYILVIGNDYDHKDLRMTLRRLSDAFPLHRIVALGCADAPAANVTALPSGDLAQAAFHRLISGARVIVYPSFYEGFGLPVVEGLAYGRPVVVRQSPLWSEIAGWSRLPGQLYEFDDVPSLVASVGRALAGVPNGVLPTGLKLDPAEAPASWQESARRLLALLNKCAEKADGSRWREREEALRLANLS